MKKIFIQGAFDLLNWGHVKAFERMSQYGEVIVGLNTDALLKEYKNRDAVLPFWQKKEILESIRFVSKVVPAHEFSPLRLLKKYEIDIYCLTREWKHTKAKEIAYMKQKGGKVMYMPRFKGVIPTSEIKNRVIQEYISGKTPKTSKDYK